MTHDEYRQGRRNEQDPQQVHAIWVRHHPYDAYLNLCRAFHEYFLQVSQRSLLPVSREVFTDGMRQLSGQYHVGLEQWLNVQSRDELIKCMQTADPASLWAFVRYGPHQVLFRYIYIEMLRLQGT